jgi:hypothetical protein
VAGHIFQARPVWIYTQSNITNFIVISNMHKTILLYMTTGPARFLGYHALDSNGAPGQLG